MKSARMQLVVGVMAAGAACLSLGLALTVFPQLVQYLQDRLPAMMIVAGAALLLASMVLLRRRALAGRAADAAVGRHREQPSRCRESQLTGMIDSIDEVLWTFEFPGWRIRYVSPAVARVYGRSAEAFHADPHLWLKSVHPADRQRVIAISRQIIAHGRQSFQYRIVRPDGEARWIRYEAQFVAGGAALSGRVDSVGTDITVQRRLEESLQRCTRALAAIRDCELVLATRGDEHVLLQGICDVVAMAGYRMAWAGTLRADGSIALAGIAGEHQDYLASLQIPLAAGVSGAATVGEALRSRQAIVANSIHDDARLAPWRDDALRCGFNAKIALPLCNSRGRDGGGRGLGRERDKTHSGCRRATAADRGA